MVFSQALFNFSQDAAASLVKRWLSILHVDYERDAEQTVATIVAPAHAKHLRQFIHKMSAFCRLASCKFSGAQKGNAVLALTRHLAGTTFIEKEALNSPQITQLGRQSIALSVASAVQQATPSVVDQSL